MIHFEYEFNLCNVYGGLCIKHEDNKYYWEVDGYGSKGYKEIPKELYDALHNYAMQLSEKD